MENNKYKSSYNYNELIEAFLSCKYSHGTTANDRLSFTGNKLYSYSSLLAVLDAEKDTLLVDSRIASYSVTSKKHAGILSNAHKGKIFWIDLYNPNEVQWGRLDNLLKEHSRARSRKPNIAKLVIREYNECMQYMDYIKVDRRTKTYKKHLNYLVTIMERKIA